MISIINNNRDLLVDGNGDSSWSGATIQSYNTNATSWALAQYLYKVGQRYAAVPLGLVVGAGCVAIHRLFVAVSPPFLSPSSPSASSTNTIPRAVQTHNQRLLHVRTQLPPVYPIRWLHPLQRLADLRHLLSGHRGFLRPVLPPQLPSSHFQGLLVPGYGCLGWRCVVGPVYPVLCGVWSWWSGDCVPELVGE